VKIHALPVLKRRELENTLRKFASSIDGSANTRGGSAPNASPAVNLARVDTTGSGRHNTLSDSTSTSQRVDSAYASMLHSGPTSSLINMHGTADNMPQRSPQVAKGPKIKSYLHEIPKGLLPKDSNVMTEKEKKELVVKRLEQIFTGKAKVTLVNQNQALQQQQEVSKSATTRDQDWSGEEGLREANMRPHEPDAHRRRPSAVSNRSSLDPASPTVSGRAGCGSPNPITSPNQRPTRPLDLDPDREQIPLDNVEYIRHLGLPTPQLTTEDSSDAEGWIYLNLLINMAQLHIMNVTPNFVRSAVSDISAKLQLSTDGKKIRWRGGKEGTRLSSDSDKSSQSGKRPSDSGSVSETGHKRRRIGGSSRQVGEHLTTSLDPKDLLQCVGALGVNEPYFYKPLFHHPRSHAGVMSTEDSASVLESFPKNSGIARSLGGPQPQGQRSRSSPPRRRVDDGPIVFYSGAKFCTDLSGDRTNIPAPLHTIGIGKDDISSHTEDAIGCSPTKSVPTFMRTISGSLTQSRPFKDYTLCSSLNRVLSADLVEEDGPTDGDAFDLGLEWSLGSSPTPTLLDLRASGLGGTQPADHFAIWVQTYRTKLQTGSQSNLSRFTRKNNTPTSLPDVFHDIDNKHNTDDLTEKLASLSAVSSSQRDNPRVFADLPVKSQIIDSKIFNLPPSKLPEPSAYYEAISTSDEESDSEDSSSSGLSQYRRRASLQHWPMTAVSQPDLPSTEDVNIHGDEETDSSNDMLAQVRAANPVVVAAQEQEFEMQIEGEVASTALIVGGNREDFSSSEESVEESDEE